MPLLRRKLFSPEKPPKSLKADDEVFYCELTGEVFVDYEAFYQRMILCNSLVWSCECTGKTNLTFKEAQESEESVWKSLECISVPLKRSTLTLVHHTKRSKIQNLTDEIFDFLKNRYQVNEKVETKIKDTWCKALITYVPDSSNVSLINKMPTLKSPNKEKPMPLKSPIGQKAQWTDASNIEYRVEILKGPRTGEYMNVKGKLLRRPKGAFTKEKMKLYLKQTCNRTTPSSDDGYWVVLPKEIANYNLGETSIAQPERKDAKKKKKKKKKNEKVDEKQNTIEETFGKVKPKKGGSAPKVLTLEQKRELFEKEKERKRLELEELKITKLKEKAQEKARKKDERDKEREIQNEFKSLELEFVKEFNKQREDLKLEDSKSLPTFVPYKSVLHEDLFGDVIMVVEFVNIFGSLFDLEQEIDSKVTLSWLEEALTEHDAEGRYYQILKFLLHSYLRMQQDENKYDMDNEDDASTSGEDTPVPQRSLENGVTGNTKSVAEKASSNARAAAIWPMLYQGMALHEITIEPFSLTEMLRLHILSSGVKIGGVVNYFDWYRQGQYQLSDDPCVSFRHKEFDIMTKLITGNVYDFTSAEKLKLLVLLCNQVLMLSTTRDYMEEALDKLKSLRKQLREIQHEENKRRRKLAQDKWKKKVAERTKHKEEIEKKKKEKAQNISQELKKDSKAQAEDTTKEDNNEGEEDNKKLTSEQQEERRMRKEAKEVQLEDFHREKFQYAEREILNEMTTFSAVISEVPLGRDRTFRRYWQFMNVDGIYIENDDDGAIKITELCDNGTEQDEDTEDEGGEVSECEEGSKKTSVPMVSFEDILQARENGKPLNQLLLNRYKCEYNDHSNEFIEKSTTIKNILANVTNGVDPSIYSVTDKIKWYNINSKEQLETLIGSLNPRGIREQRLKVNLCNEKDSMFKYFDQLELLKNKPVVARRGRAATVKKDDPNEIDKQLFKTMEDYIEGNLRDQIMELEERLWVAGLGGVKERDTWRIKIEKGIEKLIQYKPDGEALPNGDAKHEEEAMDIETSENEKTSEILVNGHHETGLEMEVDLPVKTDIDVQVKENVAVPIKTDVDAPVKTGVKVPIETAVEAPVKAVVNAPIKADVDLSIKALPLHLHDSKDRSRCSTPVNVPENNERQTIVCELAEALLQVENSIEQKYLKPPLGESEEIKKERIKEMIEGAHADHELSKGRNEGDEKTEEDEKKLSSCLNRWQQSLVKSSSLSQVFIHLNTLDRSIIWDKSVQNVKCRLCKRKGNEEEMLLCDGCDRGFHMGCLKPPLKKVPTGDWFCHDCRPLEVKRRNRKHSIQIEEETEEEVEESDTEVEEDSDEEHDENESEEEENESYDDEDDESDASSDASEHEELCTVCNNEGTLILCEACPRSFHVECCYPPMKKVPRGVWNCQICTGCDKVLPYRKRAITIERNREKSKTLAEKPRKTMKQQRGKPVKPTKTKKQLKRSQSTSPAAGRPSKRVKLDNDDSPGDSSSQRSSGGFTRQQLKQCFVFINEILKREEAEVFSVPVDLDEVPDYTQFIDEPMDFGTIKRNLNAGKYIDIESFLEHVHLVFTNCETYNQPRSSVARSGIKLKTFVNKRIMELKLES